MVSRVSASVRRAAADGVTEETEEEEEEAASTSALRTAFAMAHLGLSTTPLSANVAPFATFNDPTIGIRDGGGGGGEEADEDEDEAWRCSTEEGGAAPPKPTISM